MLRKITLLTLVAIVAISAFATNRTSVKAQAKKLTIAFVPGVNPDPFYITMAGGVKQAASDMGVDIIEQDPAKFDVTVSAPIVEALIAKGGIDALVTAPNDKQQSIPVLQKANDAGIPVITVDTFIGDGDYAAGEVKFPLSYIGSDNVEGGRIACSALATKLGKGAKIYIQNVRPGISTTDQREQGCKDAAQAAGLTVVRVDYNDNDATKAQQQTAAVLTANPDIKGMFATNTFGAQGAGAAIENAGLKGSVEVALFDASVGNVDYLKAGTVTQVIAQKPYDMGYLGVSMAVAYLDGYQSLPKRIPTGYAVLTKDNVTKPEFTRFIYSDKSPEPTARYTADFNLGFVPGVNPDPFYITMSKGVKAAVARYGITLVEQDPAKFDVTVSAPIVEALIAKGNIKALVTAPNDKQQSIPVLQKANDAGIPVITVDTFIGDGDYAAGEVKFPLSYIGSDNVEGGRIACSTLATKLGKGAKIYIQNVRPGISTTDQREQGCKDAAQAAGLTVVRVDYNDNDATKAQQQTAAVLTANPDIKGMFATNTFGAQGAGAAIENAGLKGSVSVVLFDASEGNIEFLKAGTVTQVIAQKPADMGYLGVITAIANARGVTSVPKRVPTGYAVIDAKNVGDPNIAKFIYTSK